MNKASCSVVIKPVRVLPFVIAFLVSSACMPALAQSSYQYENSISYQKHKIDTSGAEMDDEQTILIGGSYRF